MFDELFEIKPTRRILDLREAYLQGPLQTQKHPFYYSSDRWLTLPFLEGWLRYRTETTTVLRRAKAEAYALDCARPVILDGELIVGQMDFHALSAQEQARYDRLVEMFDMSPHIHVKGRADHLCLDYPKLLRVGVRGLIEEIERRRAQLRFDDPAIMADSVVRDEFYEGALIELRSLLNLAKRYAGYARRLAEESAPERREELLEIARVMERVPAYPARGLREALQSCHFYTYNLFGLYPAGRPDQYLYPYYRADIDGGRLTNAQAQELIDNYCMLFSQYSFSYAANGYMLGGRDASGAPVSNELTALFLNSIPHINMALPEASLAICKDTDEGIVDHALRILAQGYTHPALYNDDVIAGALISYGVSKEDAHHYVNTTCTEISICGKSDMWTTCPWHNLAQLLMQAFNSRDFDGVEQLYEAFEASVRRAVEEGNLEIARIQLERARNGAIPLRASCLVDDCLKQGRSLAQGGAVYNWVYPTFVGMPNVVDSLVAIDHVVFKEKKVTLREFREILAGNFEGNEALRSWILHRVPHLGNAQNECDAWMIRLMKLLDDVCTDKFTLRGDLVVPGAFSFNMHERFGNATQATPDGRKARKPLANCPVCMQGCDVSGPSAALLSATNWPQGRFLGGVAANLTLTGRLFEGDGAAAIRALVQSYFDRGGMQLQINAVDRDTLNDAVKHPEKHRNLIVRVGGYSEYFTRLSPELQQELIERIAH